MVIESLAGYAKSMVGDKVVKDKRSLDNDSVSCATTSVGDARSRRNSSLSSAPHPSTLGSLSEHNETCDLHLKFDFSAAEEAVQKEVDLLDLHDMFARATSEESSFMDLDDILATEKPKIDLPVLTVLDVNAEVEKLRARTTDWKPFQQDVLSTALAAAKPKDRVAQIMDKWEQLDKRRSERPSQHDDANKQKLLEMADELRDAFSDDSFQAELQGLLSAARQRQGLPPGEPVGWVKGRRELVRGVHRKILPMYGYGGVGSELGVHSMLLAFEPYCDDFAVLRHLAATDEMLGLLPNSTLYQVLDTTEMFKPLISGSD